MVSHSKATSNSNKTKWISTSLQAFQSNKGLKRIDTQSGGKIYVFSSFKTPRSSIVKQIQIKILGDHSRFQNLQIDNQKTHMYLKL